MFVQTHPSGIRYLDVNSIRGPLHTLVKVSSLSLSPPGVVGLCWHAVRTGVGRQTRTSFQVLATSPEHQPLRANPYNRQLYGSAWNVCSPSDWWPPFLGYTSRGSQSPADVHTSATRLPGLPCGRLISVRQTWWSSRTEQFVLDQTMAADLQQIQHAMQIATEGGQCGMHDGSHPLSASSLPGALRHGMRLLPAARKGKKPTASDANREVQRRQGHLGPGTAHYINDNLAE